MLPKNNLKAFTLIEVLVVIALIAILAAITIIAINPQQNFQDARNTERQSEVTQIVNAITQYTSENTEGQDLASLGIVTDCTTGQHNIIPDGSSVTLDADNINLGALSPTYIASIPADPSATDEAENTEYQVCISDANRVRVFAPNTEGGGDIIEAVR